MSDETKIPEQEQHRIGDRTVEMLAEKLPNIVQEALKTEFGEVLGERIERARSERDRSALLFQGRQAATNDALVERQAAEWLRCAVMRASGRPDLAAPDPELDVDGRITQALNPVAGSSGAYLLPDEFISAIEKRAPTPVVLWPLVDKQAVRSRTVKQPGVSTYITVNKGASANVNSATTATEITETVPVFTEHTWYLEDSDSRVPIKLDLLEESPIDVYLEILALVADDFARNRENLILRGQGHSAQEPAGLLTTSTGITTVTINEAPSVATVLDFVANLPARYRANATMVADSQTGFAVAAALAQNVRAAEYLAGKLPPMVISEEMEEGKLLVGDMRFYRVKYIRLLQVITSIAAERKTREVVVTETWTGQPTITDAFRIGTGVTY